MCSEAPGEAMHLEHIGVTFHRNEKGELGPARLRRRVQEAHGLRRRHHRPGDPARPLRAAHEATSDGRPLRGVVLHLADPRRRRHLRRRRRARHPHGRDRDLQREVRHPRQRRQRPVLQADDERAHLHRRRDRAGLPGRVRRSWTWRWSSTTRRRSPRTAFSSPRARAARGRTCSTPTASASWRTTRPTRWSWPRATSSRAPSRPRSTRAAASAPTGRASTSTSRSCRASACSRRCARSSTSAATSPAPTSRREPIMIRPGQHYIMGGVKTDVDGQHADHGPLRRRRGRLRVGPRRQPAGRDSLLDTLIFGRRYGEHAAKRGRDMAMPHGARRPLREDSAEIERSWTARARGGASRRSRTSFGTTMNEYVAVYRDEEGLTKAQAQPGGFADTLNARTFALAQQEIARGAAPDDEHLLDLPGRADRVPGAPRRQRRVPRARSTRTLASGGPGLRDRASPTRTSSGCWSAGRSSGWTDLRSRVERPLTDLQASARSTAATSCARPTASGIDHDQPARLRTSATSSRPSAKAPSSTTPARTSAAASRSSR